MVGQPVEVLQNDTINVARCLQNLKPGDLLFFSAAKRKGVKAGRISHTAIYMGDGQFIQSAGMVKISSLVTASPLYDSQSETLVGARRLLTAIGMPEISRVAAHGWYNWPN